MSIIFIILIVLVSVLLTLIVLVQNPKGGGLAGNIAGLSNQFMGVKQTTDVLEKGTWLFGGLIALLCVVSVFFISKSSASPTDRNEAAGATAPQPKAPAPPAGSTTVMPGTTPVTTPGTNPATTPGTTPQK
ncbi:MAG: preprotein translocase subunit SecG [Chitinophagaceae bacterium]|nr:preprotein translocase subunit SecG [Chitinophagaceae bacterium]